MVHLTTEEISKKLSEMLPALHEEYGVSQLWIVGSRARGDFRPDSDLDLMVSFDRDDISLFGFAGLENLISDELGIKVDLVERSSLRPRVAEQLELDKVAV